MKSPQKLNRLWKGPVSDSLLYPIIRSVFVSPATHRCTERYEPLAGECEKRDVHDVSALNVNSSDNLTLGTFSFGLHLSPLWPRNQARQLVGKMMRLFPLKFSGALTIRHCKFRLAGSLK